MINKIQTEKVIDIKTRAILQDMAFVLALTKRVAKEVRQSKDYNLVEAQRAWSEEENSMIIAA
ncbi:hypothetical protein KIH39_17410 [Telmatocola sphagniphila]|jgi:hypothetical protein|uniref:Uncharacterized protein n=1 Tax=Telmatocola sphagniphila TaxID=1123043 RepID=A0A8E6EWI8_9BACT|nr:hypothetical protein [Telmatocola sphagniphila]QVL30623.1 hypothetical protein KIH39_17410 [Telmatocola sphagniphila]